MILRGVIRKTITLPLIGVVFAFLSLLAPLSTPVYAAPEDATSETTENTETTSETTETTETTEAAETTEENTELPAETVESASCFDQVGAIGWIVCPAMKLISSVIDGIYSVIQDYLIVKPLTTDQASPIYLIWEFARNLANVVFLILLLVVIYSQITGLGMSNYGIKRALPRIVVAAILVNLSFLICSLAVDVSNVLGAGFRNLFNGVRETAIANGATEFTNVGVTWAELFAGLAGGGVIAGLAIGMSGGLTAVLLSLIPVLIGAVAAVAVGLITIALRQSVVALLIMISPLAFVAYLLPNTEPYFKKWYNLLFQMLIFYPAFSLLFGASQLAGWAIMASASSIFGLILGLAVQVFPLFLAVSLMKMSNTLLGRISNRLSALGARAELATRAAVTPQVAMQRSKYLAETPHRYDFSRLLAQRMNDVKTRTALDTATYNEAADYRGRALAAQYVKGGNITRRGRSIYSLQAQNLTHQAAIKKGENDLDEGLSTHVTNYRQKARLEKEERRIITALDDFKFESARSLDINLENLKSYEKRVNDAINVQVKSELAAKEGRIYVPANAEEAAALNRYRRLSGTVQGTDHGINTIVANAIAAKAKARTEITGDYLSLFNEASYTANINDYLTNSLIGLNENSMSAAIQVMMMRGDTDLVANALNDQSWRFADMTPENLAMQKRISDTLLHYKKDSAILSSYAKCLNMARGKAENTRRKNEAAREEGRLQDIVLEKDMIPDFFTFEDFLKRDGEAAKWGLDAETLINEMSESDIACSQDRTVWNYAKENDRLFFNEKQRRFALFSKPNEGEKLDSLIDAHLGKNSDWTYIDKSGVKVSDKLHRNVLSFTSEEALGQARKNVSDIIRYNSAQQIAGFKTNTMNAFATIMSDDYRLENGKCVFDLRDPVERRSMIIKGLQKMKDEGIFQPHIADDLRRNAKDGRLNTMNPEIRKLLNEVLHFEAIK